MAELNEIDWINISNLFSALSSKKKEYVVGEIKRIINEDCAITLPFHNGFENIINEVKNHNYRITNCAMLKIVKCVCKEMNDETVSSRCNGISEKLERKCSTDRILYE